MSIQEEMIRGRTKWYREIGMDRLWREWRPAAGAALSPRAAIASKIFYAGVRLLSIWSCFWRKLRKRFLGSHEHVV